MRALRQTYSYAVSGKPPCSYKTLRTWALILTESIRQLVTLLHFEEPKNALKTDLLTFSEFDNEAQRAQTTTARTEMLGIPAHGRIVVAHVPALHFVPSAVSGQYRRYALVCNTPI